jgi:hypothetical protein
MCRVGSLMFPIASGLQFLHSGGLLPGAGDFSAGLLGFFCTSHDISHHQAVYVGKKTAGVLGAKNQNTNRPH